MHKLESRSPKGRGRGFTLVELLTAIVIIALLAALATPSFISMIRDRRVVRSGLFLIDSYREGRTRALSRGVAVLLRWRADGNGRGAMTMREVIVASGTGVPKGCSTADWSDGSADTREVSKYTFTSAVYELAEMKLFSTAGVETTLGDVCYSPDGQAYVRYADNDTMTPLTGVLRYDIRNTRTSFKRVVFVPPNGVARYQL